MQGRTKGGNNFYESWNNAASERDTCRGTLQKVSEETILILNKKYIAKEELSGYFSKVDKILENDSTIKAVAE